MDDESGGGVLCWEKEECRRKGIIVILMVSLGGEHSKAFPSMTD